MKLVLVVGVLCLLSTPVRAERDQRVSVTWSPIHLVLPVVELTGEYNVAPHMGAGAILGAGRVTNDDETVTATAIEVGAQFNYYFLDRFSGLHAGVEGIYLHLSDVEQDLTASGAGFAVGPYAGYKLMTSIGFTFVAQLGVSYLAINAKTSTQTSSDSKVSPLLNLNVGWSF